jgi:hypothetical protein
LCTKDAVVATTGSVQAELDKIEAAAPSNAVEVAGYNRATANGDIDETDVAGRCAMCFCIDNCACGRTLTDRYLKAYWLIGDMVANVVACDSLVVEPFWCLCMHHTCCQQEDEQKE